MIFGFVTQLCKAVQKVNFMDWSSLRIKMELKILNFSRDPDNDVAQVLERYLETEADILYMCHEYNGIQQRHVQINSSAIYLNIQDVPQISNSCG